MIVVLVGASLIGRSGQRGLVHEGLSVGQKEVEFISQVRKITEDDLIDPCSGNNTVTTW